LALEPGELVGERAVEFAEAVRLENALLEDAVSSRLESSDSEVYGANELLVAAQFGHDLWWWNREHRDS